MSKVGEIDKIKEAAEAATHSSSVSRRDLLLGGTIFAATSVLASGASVNPAHGQQNATQSSGKSPNILVIFGDDIGIPQISAYTMGLMGYRTPNIDRIAAEGAIFTDSYGQQSCTAGRASFILGQEPFRTGLLTIGMPGDPHGIQEWMPTIADVLRTKGYATGQFGKNHLGDHDEHLPTNHGFDEFFGNLYHLNAEEEPEGYFYPKDPEFRKKYGPRGVIHSYADGKIEDTGALNTKRMETIDEEFLAAAKDFIDPQHKADKPFFVWFNATRMHVFTHLKKESLGKTGKGIHADGMVEHDGMVGELLQQLDDLGITEDTIVLYTTDNGAEIALWPDGAMTPFHGEKGTTWEGGFRIPMMVRWPGVVKPGTQVNEIVTLMDWMPTFATAAGIPDIRDKMKSGFQAGSKTFKVHLDGYDLTSLLKGEAKDPPRDTVYYLTKGETLTPLGGTIGSSALQSPMGTLQPERAKYLPGHSSPISGWTLTSGDWKRAEAPWTSSPETFGCWYRSRERSRNSSPTLMNSPIRRAVLSMRVPSTTGCYGKKLP